MLRRLSVRGKILAALAVPVLVLFAAAAIISGQAISTARDASQTSSLVAALAAQDAAGAEIAAERTLAILDSHNQEGANEAMMEQREKTDRTLDARDRAYEKLDISALDPRVQNALKDTIADRRELTAVRQGIDRSDLGEVSRTNSYSGLIDDALDVPRALADTTPDRGLAQYLDAYVVLDELLAQQALEQPIVTAVLDAAQLGEEKPSTNQRAAVIVTTGDTLAAETRRTVRDLPGDLTLDTFGATYNQIRGNITGSRPAATPPSQAEEWPKLSQEDRDKTAPVRDTVRSQTAEEASSLAAAATTRAVLTILLTVAAVVASVLVAGLIARAIVNPLRRLTDAAEDVRDQLPRLVEQVAVPGQGPSIDLAPITVESSDEVGQLATAFNDVNSTTVKVAREQAALRGSIAEMFVNVARRDQVLLNRQLAFLDDLERSEEDPGTLSNLFRLDHLATRMRRNAESLLVLAGIDSGRRVRQPMPASDVIRTASSEIELYDRVRLNLVVDPLMLGHNALNAAHLLAELLENATMFSEPHTPVEVTTGRDEHFVRVTIRDHGLGMTAEEIADANRKVATHAATDVVGAQRLGLYVVGRIADRLGARVVFAAGPDETGTEVTVLLPAVLFVPDSNVPLPTPTDPLETSTQAAAQQLSGTGVVPALPAPAPTATSSFPAAQPPATSSFPAAQPAAASSFATAEPEAPLAVPVDLDALTDGTTGTGMPRRRSSRTVDPAAAAPSASFASGPQTGAIVLPPLAAPTLPDQMPAADEAWTPPEEVAAASSSLPSRSRQAAPRVEPESEEIPVLDVSTRSALFSSFRPIGERPAEENPVELPAAPDVSATDIPLVDHEVQEEARWSVEQPVEQAWAPQTSYEDALDGPAGLLLDLVVDETTVARVPLGERTPLGASSARQPADASAPHGEPALAETPSDADVPVVEAGATAGGNGDDIPAELTFEALPRFEELMADLPTRRSLRESQARKRGIFGRRPRTSAVPLATSTSGPSPEALASSPAGAPAPSGPAPAPATQAPAAHEPAAPARSSAFAPRTGRSPAAAEAGTGFAPAAPSPDRTSVLPAFQDPASAGRTEPAAYGDQAYAPATQPAAPAEPTYAPVEQAYAPSETPSPAQREWAPAAPTPAADEAPGYGPPTPLVRRPVQDDIEPLEPGYVRDSVEARSDWMASAVLYEEMSTLLQGSTDFQEATLADPNDGIYQPLTVDATTTTSGLTRRARGQEREGYVDRFTASIDRDPEQLRARLSAFQSATARGRVEGQDDAGSTWTPQSMDYVPDSAPQAR